MPGVAMEPDATGIAADFDEMDGFHQPTAMFDKGELLGDLADEMEQAVPDTRAAVEVEAAPKGCRLIIVAGPDIGLEWSFKQAEITMGRGAENEIDFADIAASRHHARISLEGTEFFLADLDSNNGTLLNGVRITREALCSGDEIVIGARTMRFVELDQAPPTAAAHPVVPAGPEPVVGSPSEIIPAIAGEDHELDGSQVDVGVVPEDDGPGADVDEPPIPIAATKKRTGLKVAAIGIGGFAVAASLAYMGLIVYERLTGNTAQAQQERAHVAFLQGVELVKALRCGDAIVMFDRVLATRPEYTRAKEYKAFCVEEIARWKRLAEAKALASSGSYEPALAKLDKIDAISQYRPEADNLGKLWRRRVALDKVAEAQRMFDDGDIASALELLDEVLAGQPGLAPARRLRATIISIREAARSDRPKAAKASAIPTLMERSVSLYIKGRISSAIDAANAAGGADAPIYVERMTTVKRITKEAKVAHRQKAGGELLRLAPKGLDLDLKIAAGKGKIRARLKTYYADGLYLKGLEAYNDADYGRAYKLLSEAVRVEPGHKLSETRLAALGRKARELYYQGYVLKDSNAAETRKIFRQVKQMTSTSSQFHKWASKWLSANGG